MKIKLWHVIFLELIVIALAGVIGTAVSLQRPPVSRTIGNKDISKHRPTQGSLTTAYHEINRDFFYGGLPEKKTTIVFTDLSSRDIMGRIEQRPDGTWIIFIDTETHPLEKEAEMTLIHEMCHQDNKVSNNEEGFDGHGDQFQACMIQHAKNGVFKGLW